MQHPQYLVETDWLHDPLEETNLRVGEMCSLATPVIAARDSYMQALVCLTNLRDTETLKARSCTLVL